MPHGDLAIARPALLSSSDVAVLLMLQLLGELHGSLDTGSEVSVILGRARSMLGDWEALGRLIDAPGTPFERDARPALAQLRDLLDRSEPLLARIARPPMLAAAPPARSPPG